MTQHKESTMQRTPDQIRSELAIFEAQFQAFSIPAGTPHRKSMLAAAQKEAFERSCSPENVACRLALHAELRKAQRSAKIKVAAARRKADPQEQIRQWVFRRLRLMGFSRETKTVSGSAYYSHPALRVRVSDHDVPLTAERQEAALSGGFTWALGWSLAIAADTTWVAAARWLVEVRRELRREAVVNV